MYISLHIFVYTLLYPSKKHKNFYKNPSEKSNTDSAIMCSWNLLLQFGFMQMPGCRQHEIELRFKPESQCCRLNSFHELYFTLCVWTRAGTQLSLILLLKEEGSYGSTQRICRAEMCFEELLFLACVGAAMYLGHGREEQQCCFARNPKAALWASLLMAAMSHVSSHLHSNSSLHKLSWEPEKASGTLIKCENHTRSLF